ncbi:hypothetical protein MFIFM68171_09753 [Madurella fahalii]|uniref:Uncharacterized protein n=1 Tax=Madurella fahalii TaxID=1157608 RepID=A0ABQ0GP78_9PEZI
MPVPDIPGSGRPYISSPVELRSKVSSRQDDRIDWSDAKALQELLERQPHHLDTEGGRRIVILESQAPAFIDVLGVYFGIHPAFFVDQERESVPESFQATGDFEMVALPSTVRDSEHVSMKYYELIHVPPELRRFRAFCAESGRPLSTTRVLGQFTDTGTLHRKYAA